MWFSYVVETEMVEESFVVKEDPPSGERRLIRKDLDAMFVIYHLRKNFFGILFQDMICLSDQIIVLCVFCKY